MQVCRRCTIYPCLAIANRIVFDSFRSIVDRFRFVHVPILVFAVSGKFDFWGEEVFFYSDNLERISVLYMKIQATVRCNDVYVKRHIFIVHIIKLKLKL